MSETTKAAVVETETGDWDRELRRAERQLQGKIRRSRWIILLERLWPRLWLPFAIACLFLLVTMLGLWQVMGPGLHKFLLALFLTAFVLALLPLLTVRLPSRQEALARLERQSGLRHRPATSFEDEIATQGSNNRAVRRLWLVHRLRQARRFAALKSGQFNAHMERYDPYALRAALLLALVIAAIALGRDFRHNLDYALNLRKPVMPPADVRLDAWVNPPLYTGKPPVLLTDNKIDLNALPGITKQQIEQSLASVRQKRASDPAKTQLEKQNQTGVKQISERAVPENSRLIVRFTGEGRGRYQLRILRDGKPVSLEQVSPKQEAATQAAAHSAVWAGASNDTVREHKVLLRQPLQVQVLRGHDVVLAWQFNIIEDNIPAIALVRPPQTTHRGALRLEYRVADDYGVKSASARFRLDKKSVAGKPMSAPSPLPLQSDPKKAPEMGNEDHAIGALQKGGKNFGQKDLDRRPVQDNIIYVEEPLVEPPHFALRLPRDHLKRGNGKVYRNLAAHPWAGLPVEMVLSATDHAGQTGYSEVIKLRLPERQFRKPLARAVIALRKKLVARPSRRYAIARGLDYLTQRAAQTNYQDLTVYLGLRTAVWRLRYDGTRPSLKSTVKLLWDLAVRIEDGDLSDAERALRAAQEKLMEALSRKAPDEEIHQLMQQLRQAMMQYLRSLSQQAAREMPPEMAKQLQNARVLDQQSLEQILKNIENLAKIGERDKAQQMLSQLRDLLENLRAGQNGQMQGAKGAQQMMQAIDGLGRMIMKQQQLLDQTFQLKRQEDQRMFQGLEGQANRFGRPQQGQRGQQGQNRYGAPRQGSQSGPRLGSSGRRFEQGSGQGQEQGNRQSRKSGQGGKPGNGGPPTLGDVQRGQQDLVNDLVDLLGRLQRSGMPLPRDLKGAARSMQRAGENLYGEQLDRATQNQSRALDNLRKGTQQLAEQVLKQLGTRIGRSGRDSHDPAGRPTGTDGPTFGLNVKVPDEIVIQRAREVLEELRRRLSDPTRPSLELDYIERLIQRF